MIIFGWGKQTIWTIGAVFKQLCSNCNNEDYWVLIRRTTWFTLFFIPVIPYNTEWLLLCPVCQYGIKLKSEQVDKYKPLAEANKELTEGKITAEQYTSRISALLGTGSSSESSKEEPKTIEEAEKIIDAEVIDQTDSKFCGECGKDLLPEGKFCTHCGTATKTTAV